MRSLCEIACEISADWKKVHYTAVPYLNAMMCLDKITDMYGVETAKEQVLRFLCNAGSWTGAKAREIKKELKQMCK